MNCSECCSKSIKCSECCSKSIKYSSINEIIFYEIILKPAFNKAPNRSKLRCIKPKRRKPLGRYL